MEAVYGLLGVDRGVPEVWGSVYDIRDLLDLSLIHIFHGALRGGFHRRSDKVAAV